MRGHMSSRCRAPAAALGLAALLAALLVLIQAPHAQAALTPALRDRLVTAPGRPAPVLVTLREQVDPSRYAGRPRILLRRLRALADRTHPSVIAEAGAPARRFWITNALALELHPARIRALGRLRTVASVDLDRTVSAAQAPALSTPPPDPASVPGAIGIVQSLTQLPLDAIGARPVWTRYGLRGAGVLMGNIDTGVDAANPDLAGKIAGFRDFVNGRTEPYDDNGHGTHTIGTMVGGSATGTPIGVAPEARVLVAKALGADGGGLGSALIAAAQWMADPDGDPATADFPAVVNNSWSGGEANDPWFHQVIRVWLAQGIVPIFAAGNSGPDAQTIASPASYPGVLAVAALDDAGVLADFSSRGPVVWQNVDAVGPAAGTALRKADLAAPGVGIVSSVGIGYETYSGTSMAAPHVAGVIALVKQAAPELTGADLARVVTATATDLGPVGDDPGYGVGAVSALSAVASVLGPRPDPAPGAPLISPPPLPPAPVRPPTSEPRTPAATSPLRVVRARTPVVRRGGRVALSGLLTDPARVRATLMRRAAAARPGAAGVLTVAGNRPAGRFRLAVPLRRAPVGRYWLVVQAQTRSGRPIGRPVRLSLRIARPADPRLSERRVLAALDARFRAQAKVAACPVGRESARRAAHLHARAMRAARAPSARLLRERAALAARAVTVLRSAHRLCARVAQTEPAVDVTTAEPVPPPAPAPGVGSAGPAVMPVTLAGLVNGQDIDLSGVLGDFQLPAQLGALELERLEERVCRGIAVICLGLDRPLLNEQLKDLVNRNQLTLALRNLASGEVQGILVQLTTLLDQGDLSQLISVQRVGDRVLRLAPLGPLARISGLPDIPDVAVGRLQVAGVLRCQPATVRGLPRVCVA